ncbi:right-handed parallel beta-helix repeat-containing protein [Herbiconiux sp. A18JL235]|uniref:Right-handed parallel beta-helix repeat-containing protein n=1 Tax=Herbiconiux sp. A18JL235 TaxID=3152363 RepID=A0AB39BE03_9MICO
MNDDDQPDDHAAAGADEVAEDGLVAADDADDAEVAADGLVAADDADEADGSATADLPPADGVDDRAEGGDSGSLTAVERGDTMGRGRRMLVRLGVGILIVGSVAAVVLVLNGVPARVSAFLGSVASAVVGAPATPGASGTPSAPAATTTSAADTPATAAGPATPVEAAPAVDGEGTIDVPPAPGDGTTDAAPAPGDGTTDAAPATGDGTTDVAPATGDGTTDAASAAGDGEADAPPVSGDRALVEAAAQAVATMGPTPTWAPYPVDEDSAYEAALVAAHDARWSMLARGLSIVSDPAGSVMVLSPIGRPYTLDDLIDLGGITRVDDTTVLMTKTIFVGRGAELDLSAPGQTLRMSSGASGFTPLVVWGGTLKLTGAEDAPFSVTSWNAADGGPDLDTNDGRAYIRVHEGTLVADRIAVANLGFYSGRTGGLALTGSTAALSTGTISHSRVDGDHIGLFLDSATKVAVDDTTFAGSLDSGVLVSGVLGLELDTVTVSGSGAQGVEVRPGSADVAIRSSTLSDNARYGLDFDGTPPVAGANPGGLSPGNAWWLTLEKSTLSGNGSGGAQVSGTSGVQLTDNAVEQSRLGLRLTDSQGSVTGNRVSVASGSGIVVEGAHTSLTVSGNTVSGEGPSAIVTRDGADDVTATGNDDSGWTERWEVLLWVEAHPLALLWGLLLVIPVLGIAFVFYRVRRQRTIRELVESTTIALARADLERYRLARGVAVSADAPSAMVSDAVVADAVVADAVLAGAPSTGAGLGVGLVAAAGAGVGAAAGDPLVPRRTKLSGVAASGGSSDVWLVGGPPGRDVVEPAPRGAASPPGASAAPGARSAVAAAPRSGVDAGAGAAPSASAVPSRNSVPSLPASIASLSTGRGAPGAGLGSFSSVEELAVAAVLDAGKPIDRVAHALRVPVGSVAGWVAKARRARESAL